jgi:hypothetical protein
MRGRCVPHKHIQNSQKSKDGNGGVAVAPIARGWISSEIVVEALAPSPYYYYFTKLLLHEDGLGQHYVNAFVAVDQLGDIYVPSYAG